MIHRQNWLDTRAWLNHMERVHGRDPKTIEKYRKYLRHLIEWADNTPLPSSRNIDPVFPTYLMTARNDGKSIPLSYTTIYKTLATTRMFFQFACRQWPRYAKVSESWIELLYPNRLSRPEPQLGDHKYFSIDEMRAIVSVSTETLRESRAQAAACMLFLSGMRADTLASLPIACVDLPNMRIFQVPSMGPRTKNNKAAITYLLDIPDLLRVVQSWDLRVRSRFQSSSLWYPSLNHDGMDMYETMHAILERATIIRDDIALICKKAGVDYLSPHKFRHGHIVYARGYARNMAEVKAVSQNVMHANTIITDQIYSNLKSDQVHNVITNLGKQELPAGLNEEVSKKLTELLALLNKSN